MGIGAKIHPAVASGIATGGALVSFPLSLVTVPEVFAEVYSVQFPSRFNS